MPKYKVFLQATQAAEVTVEAADYVEAHRKAKEAVRKGQGKPRTVGSWTPTMVSKLD